MKIRYIDIGLNLFSSQFHDRDRILTESLERGVSFIITGSDMKSSQETCSYVRDHPVWGTCGIHPHNADRAADDDFQELENMISSEPSMVAVGECGLDFNRMFSEKGNQIRCLERHIEIAEKMGKPMFLHERDASDTFCEVFSHHPKAAKNAVVHCFTGTRAEAERYLDMGFHIGITGWICEDRRADDIRNAVKSIPLDRILLETDAPYLTPRNIKGLGRVNYPWNITYIAAELAKDMCVDEELLVNSALDNTRRLFGLERDL